MSDNCPAFVHSFLFHFFFVGRGSQRNGNSGGFEAAAAEGFLCSEVPVLSDRSHLGKGVATRVLSSAPGKSAMKYLGGTGATSL